MALDLDDAGRKMQGQSELQEIALNWIRGLPPKKRFAASDIYSFLNREYNDKVKASQLQAKEPRFQYDARWAIQTAKHQRLIVHVRRDEWERTEAAQAMEL